MRNHFYLHSSNYDYAQDIQEDKCFIPVFEYPQTELQKTSPHEWGKIQTKSNDFHIILGNPPQEGCPWCGCEPIMQKKRPQNDSMIAKPSIYFLQCPKCGSRGPSWIVHYSTVNEKQKEEEIENLIKSRFKLRLSHDFKKSDGRGVNDINHNFS